MDTAKARELLNKSVEAFSNKLNKVEIIAFNRVYTKTGYNYIIPIKSKKKYITCSIELDVNYELSENIGYYKDIKAFVYTQEKLVGSFYLKYKDLYIFINGFDNYTESLSQYKYNGVAIRSDRVILLDKNISDTTYGFNCMDIITDIPNYTILPHYENISINDFKDGVILMGITEQESPTMLYKDLSNNSINQNLIDNVKFLLINIDRSKALTFLEDLQDFSLKNLNFGIVSNPIIKEIKDYDNVSNLRTIAYEINIKISYNVATLIEKEQKAVNKIIFCVKGVDI